jgi:hypothetical protein
MDATMTLRIDSCVVATARFSEHAAADSDPVELAAQRRPGAGPMLDVGGGVL